MLCVCVLGTKGSDDGVQKNAYREAEEATEVMVRRRAGTPTLARLCRSVWNIVKVYFFSKKSHSIHQFMFFRDKKKKLRAEPE